MAARRGLVLASLTPLFFLYFPAHYPLLQLAGNYDQPTFGAGKKACLINYMVIKWL
jgi:hypothetical protein